MIRRLQEAVLAFTPARWAVALGLLCRGTIRLRAGHLYRALLDLCWVVRVAEAGALGRHARRVVLRIADELRLETPNPLIASYQADAASTACAQVYSLAGGTHDIFRDLIVLKRATASEKGVIMLKYARTFDGVVALFDLPRLMERYLFVLEPCWAGYCHPSTLLYVTKDQPVFVQCFTEEDYQFVADVGAPLIPVRLGPADWVDAEVFTPPAVTEKPYDLVMVANWSRQKRHLQLFKALRAIKDRTIRVLLIGFSWAGRTADDIRREAQCIDNPRISIEIVENVPQPKLVDYVSRCKAFVFLNRKEGDNKALVEALFSDLPAIVYDRSIGGARSRINPSTGLLASDDALADRIAFMLDHYRDFQPRAWALEHSGSAIATRRLNTLIKQTVLAAGGKYTDGIVEKTNSPNLAYKDRTARSRFQADYEFVMSCRRGVPDARPTAVA
jgi:glycosyltransferase involved in cell wall biosynthesis